MASKGGNARGESKSSGVRQAAGGGAAKISYKDLRKLADATYKGDIRAAVYSLDPKVVTATVDSFGGNIDRTNRPMYVHRDKDGKITGYSTTNSGDALDRGVKPEGRFQSVLVPFVRQGKDGPEYTEDYNVAQKWYDESGQHYGKFDMDFTTPETKARSIDRFNAASWLVHREQQLRYQPEFDKFVEAERRQAAKAGDAGRSESSGVPSGHNPALDGYGGPRVVINPTTFKNEKDGLCVAFNEAFRIVMEANGFDPVAEPTEKQRQFFADTAYNDDERMLRRTILARICTFDTSVTDPTDEQLQEAVEFLDTVLEIGAPQNQWEQRAVERIRTAISRALESGERVPASQAPAPEDSPEVAAGGAGSSAGGVPEDEEKDSGARPNEETQAAFDSGKTEDDPLKKDLEKFSQDFQEELNNSVSIADSEEFTDPLEGKNPWMEATGAVQEFLGRETKMGSTYDGQMEILDSDPSKKGDLVALNETLQGIQREAEGVDASHIKYGPQEPKVPTMDDVGKAVAEKHQPEVVVPGDDDPVAPAQPAAPAEQQPVQQAVVAPQQETLAPGLSRRGSRNNILEFNGRRISQREFDRIQARFRKGGGAQQPQAAQPVQHPQVVANDVDDTLKPNNLRQSTQIDSGRRDALGRKLDDRGRVIA